MAFTTSAESFNFYKTTTPSLMEARAKAIEADIAANPDADIKAYQAELEGIQEALLERRGDRKPAGYTTPERKQIPDLGMTAAKRTPEDARATPEYRSAFFASMMGRALTPEQSTIMAETRADAFNSSSNSAAVLPTTTLDEVIRRARDKGGIISIARAFHYPTGIAVPVAGPGSMAQWHTEGAKVETEKFDTTSVVFDGHELLRLFSISKKVEVMSIPAFEAEIVNELSESIFETIAKTLVDGDGEGKGEGIDSIEWVEGANLLSPESFSWRDLLDLMGMLHRGYGEKASFVCNARTLYTKIYGAFSDDNVPVYLLNLQDAGSMRLVGKPIVIDDHVDDDTVYYGDFSKIAFNLPEGIALDRSTEAGFNTGTISYRGMAIADSKVLLPEAFVKMEL